MISNNLKGQRKGSRTLNSFYKCYTKTCNEEIGKERYLEKLICLKCELVGDEDE